MSHTKWMDEREEITETDGTVTSRKIIREAKKPSKKVLGINADAIDTLIKLAGLVTIFIAVLQYWQHIKEQDVAEQNFRIQQSKTDSSLSHDLMKMQQSSQQFDEQMTNNLKQIAEKSNADKEKELWENNVSILTNTAIDMEVLTNTPVFSREYDSAKKQLLFQLYPKISILGNEQILNKFLEFKDFIGLTEACYSIADVGDTVAGKLTALAGWIKNDSILAQRFNTGVAAHASVMPAVSGAGPMPEYINAYNEIQLLKAKAVNIGDSSKYTLADRSFRKYALKVSDSLMIAVNKFMQFFNSSGNLFNNSDLFHYDDNRTFYEAIIGGKIESLHTYMPQLKGLPDKFQAQVNNIKKEFITLMHQQVAVQSDILKQENLKQHNSP